MVENIPDMAAILDEMREKFLESAQEKLDRMDEILDLFISGDPLESELQEEFLREVHSMKGMGGTFEMPLVTKLCHALEAYVEDEETFNVDIATQLHAYVDRIVALIASGEAGDVSRLAHWLDGLPLKGGDAVDKPIIKLPLVLIAIQKKELMDITKANLIDRGFDIVTTQSPFEAFELAMMQAPNIVIVSQSFRSMDGAELLRSLSATQKMSKAKTAMVCPDRRKALDENLQGVQLLSEKNIERDMINFIALTISI